MKWLTNTLSSTDVSRLLAYKPFLYFSLSVLFSQIAFNMLSIILIFLVFYLTNSTFAVSMLILTFLIPQIILSFIGGILADLRDKKKILVYGNIIRAAALLLLFFNSHSIVIVYFVSLIISVATQFYVPAETPIIPFIVKREYLVTANSLFGIGLFGSILVSYVLAGPAITILGRSNVFIVLSLLFAAAALFAGFLPKIVSGALTEKSVRHVKNSIRSEFKESYMLLKTTTHATGAFFLLTLSQVVVLILATVVPGYAKGILGVPAEDLSLLLFAPAAFGMILTAILLGSVFAKINRSTLMTTGLFIAGFVFLLFPFTSKIVSRSYIDLANAVLPGIFKITTLHIVNFLAFFAGVSNALIFVPSQTIIQETIPDNFRSKIYGLLFGMIGVFSLFPILVAGGVADIIGVGSVLFLLGASVILIGISRLRLVSHSLLQHK